MFKTHRHCSALCSGTASPWNITPLHTHALVCVDARMKRKWCTIFDTDDLRWIRRRSYGSSNNNTYSHHCPFSVTTDHKINRTLTQAHYTEAATPVDNQVAASLAPKSVEVISEMGVIARNAVGARAPLH